MVILVKFFPVPCSICIRRTAQSLLVVWRQMLKVKSRSMTWSQVTTTLSKQQRQLVINWTTVSWTSRLNFRKQPRLRPSRQRMLRRLVQLFWTRPTAILVKLLLVQYSIFIRKTVLRSLAVWRQMLRVKSRSMIWSQATTTLSKQQRQLAMN